MSGCFFSFCGSKSIKDSQIYESAARAEFRQREEQRMEDENATRTEGIIGTVNDTIAVGNKTKTQLNKQGKQIDRVNDDLDDIATNTKKINRDVRGIRSWRSMIWNHITPCCAPKNKKRRHDSEDMELDEGTNTTLTPSRADDAAQRTNENLNKIDQGLDKLDQLADDMNIELHDQLHDIDKADANANKRADEIEKTTGKIKKAQDDIKKPSLGRRLLCGF